MTPGMHTTEMAIIRPRFAVTLPTALPTAMSTFPCTAASMDTSSSGSVVARLTMVAPTTSFGMPLISAIQEAASTKKSPPLTIRMMPARKTASMTASSIVPLPFPVVRPLCEGLVPFTVPRRQTEGALILSGSINFTAP